MSKVLRPKSAGKATRRQRIGAPERRAQILRVAGDMFARDGIDHTSMRKIAAEAGVTATLLYRHFADKEALLKEIGDEFFVLLSDYLDRAAADETDALTRLKVQMRAYVICGIENPRAYHLTFMTALPRLKRGASMKAFRDRLRRGEVIAPEELHPGMICFGRLESAVAGVVKANLTRVKDVAALSEVVWAAGHGLVSLVITHSDFGFTETETLVDMSVDMMLNGIIRPDAAPRPRRA